MVTLERKRLENDGYVVLEGLLDPQEDIAPVVGEYDERLSDLSKQWFDEGKLSKDVSDLPFDQRLTQVAKETEGGYYQYLDISLPVSGITSDTPMHTGPEVFKLLRNEKLLDAVEKFIGPEIFCNPVQHTRIKPPVKALPEDKRWHAGIARTQWHQDLGVVTEEADESEMLTVWLPVTESTEENGCLTVVPKSHKHGLDQHCIIADNGKTGIPDKDISGDQVPLPMKPGDVLFMTKYTQHGSLENLSDTIRWSLDLRYNPIGDATGRPWFPGFIARSREKPETELHDHEKWAERWWQTRDEIVKTGIPSFRRWDPNDPLCA